MERVKPDELALKDKVIYINRVAKVVKGGKRFSFSALVVVGDGNGFIGVGKGKAQEVPEAIRKAIEKAKKSLVKIPLRNLTISFDVIGHYGAEDVLLRPAAAGTGIIAGGPVRAVMEMIGVKNIISKCLGSGNPFNVVKATLDALIKLKYSEEIRRSRHAEAIEAS